MLSSSLSDVQIPCAAPKNLQFWRVFVVNDLVFRWPKNLYFSQNQFTRLSFRALPRILRAGTQGLPVGDSHGSSLVGG